jgi:hypothetical protein
VICPKCDNNSSMRVHRSGFLQQSVLIHLGLYPWQCGVCGQRFLFRSRGHGSRRSQPTLDPSSSNVSRR